MPLKLQQDFLLLFQCIIDFGADVLRDCTKEKIKTNYQTDDFKIVLGKTKHHLFHQFSKQKKICCACPFAGCNIQKTWTMDRRIFDKFYFYDKTLRCSSGHHSANGKTILQTCICRYIENNKVLDDLELSDLNCLLRSLSMMTSIEEMLLIGLMDVRGKVCHAVTTKSFSQHELTNLWTIFVNSVCKLCPSDPKYLKKAIDLTKSSVLSDDKILELVEKVQQVITDCNEIKPVIMEYTDKFNVFENRQNEHNTRVETRLERLEKLYMGHFEEKQSNTQATVSVYESEKSNITDVTYSGKQGDRYIECEVNCPGLDEDKTVARLATLTDVNSSKELKIESVEKHCILLKLSTRPEVFESEESLHSAIMALLQKIADAGNIDTLVESKMDIKITFTSPLTDDERHTIVSMLGAYGTINEGYATEAADKDEGIGDIDSNEMDYSYNNKQDEKKIMFSKEENMTEIENPVYTSKKEDLKNMPMDLQDNFLKKEPNGTESLDFQSGTVKMEATEQQNEQEMKIKNSMEDNDIVCEHCKNVISCYKCTEKQQQIMEITSLLKMKDAFIERLQKKMKSENDATNEVMREPIRTHTIPMQQDLGCLQDIMSTSNALSQSGEQQSGSEQLVQSKIDHDKLPIIQNCPIQGQNGDRKIIWSGRLEYHEKIPSIKMVDIPRRLQCQISIKASDPEIITTTWPKEMIVQFKPKSLLLFPHMHSYKSSRKVAFVFGDNHLESLRSLRTRMDSGYFGCVHFPKHTDQSDIRVLLLFFSEQTKTNFGLIPYDQKNFADNLRNKSSAGTLKSIQTEQQPHIQQMDIEILQLFEQLPFGFQKVQSKTMSPKIQQPAALDTMQYDDIITQTSDMHNALAMSLAEKAVLQFHQLQRQTQQVAKSTHTSITKTSIAKSTDKEDTRNTQLDPPTRPTNSTVTYFDATTASRDQFSGNKDCDGK